jgi:hypothetical protein
MRIRDGARFWRRGVQGGIVAMLAIAFFGPFYSFPLLLIILIVVVLLSPGRLWILAGALVGAAGVTALYFAIAAVSCRVDPTSVCGNANWTTPILFVLVTGLPGVAVSGLLFHVQDSPWPGSR